MRPGLKLATIGSRTLRTNKQHGKAGIPDRTVGHNNQEGMLGSIHRHGKGEISKLEQTHGIMRTHQVTIASEHT